VLSPKMGKKATKAAPVTSVGSMGSLGSPLSYAATSSTAAQQFNTAGVKKNLKKMKSKEIIDSKSSNLFGQTGTTGAAPSEISAKLNLKA